MIDKRTTPDTAVAEITDGASIAIGGFGRAGVPYALLRALVAQGATGLHIYANNAGFPGEGIGMLVDARRLRRFSGSFPTNEEFFAAHFAGDIDLELIPQGTLAERLRAGGAGLGGFYTPTGAGVAISDGGIPETYVDGVAMRLSEPKEVRVLDGILHTFELPIRPDFALIRADEGDRYGNLRFRLGSRNFNPLAAMAARRVFVEVGALREDPLPPDDIHLPGAFVDGIAVAADEHRVRLENGEIQ